MLYHGDYLDFIREMADASVDLLLTDPPFQFQHIYGGGFANSRKYTDGRLAKMSASGFSPLAFLDAVFSKLKIPNMVIFCSRDQIPIYAAWCQQHDLRFDLHVWYKTNAIPFTNNVFKSDLEYVVLMWKSGRHFVTGMVQAYYSKAYISSTVSTKNGDHISPKPLGLMRKYVGILSAPGDTVFDPFMGSGTVGIASYPTRKFMGCEIDDVSYNLAVENMTRVEAQTFMSFS
jgi:site-specific DNA-methyltransferase (adenine-specific)